jgi:hypothetical protein
MQTSLSVGLSVKIPKAVSTDNTDQSVSRSVSENPKGNLCRPDRPDKPISADQTDQADQSVSRSV